MHNQHMVELIGISDKTLQKTDQKLLDESRANMTEVIKLIQNSTESNTVAYCRSKFIIFFKKEFKIL